VWVRRCRRVTLSKGGRLIRTHDKLSSKFQSRLVRDFLEGAAKFKAQALQTKSYCDCDGREAERTGRRRQKRKQEVKKRQEGIGKYNASLMFSIYTKHLLQELSQELLVYS
jgi:hypothetical protein